VLPSARHPVPESVRRSLCDDVPKQLLTSRGLSITMSMQLGAYFPTCAERSRFLPVCGRCVLPHMCRAFPLPSGLRKVPAFNSLPYHQPTRCAYARLITGSYRQSLMCSRDAVCDLHFTLSSSPVCCFVGSEVDRKTGITVHALVAQSWNVTACEHSDYKLILHVEHRQPSIHEMEQEQSDKYKMHNCLFQVHSLLYIDTRCFRFRVP
jgi:hypothetical protein